MNQPEKTDSLKTERSRLRRAHDRGHYDRTALDAVLAAMPMAHIAYQMDGQPRILPTLQWREGDHVYWHGSAASRALRAMAGQEVCMTVSCLDGYVLARAAFHHSVNFRSAMVFGKAERITGPEATAAHLKTMVEMLFPDRWDSLRPMSAKEVKATMVMRMPLTEGAAKIRSGAPNDDAADYDLPIWAGVVPITMEVQDPISDPANLEGIEPPTHLSKIRIG